MTNIIQDCALQSAAIITPVFAGLIPGIEVGLKHNYSPIKVAHAVFLSVSTNSAAHFVKCLASHAAQSVASEYVASEYKDIASPAIEATLGAAKYAMVDYMHPEQSINIARIVAGSWNAIGYNQSPLIENTLNISSQTSPVVIEAIDSSIEAQIAGDPILLSSAIGAVAGICVSAAVEYIYIPISEFLNSEEKEHLGEVALEKEL